VRNEDGGVRSEERTNTDEHGPTPTGGRMDLTFGFDEALGKVRTTNAERRMLGAR